MIRPLTSRLFLVFLPFLLFPASCTQQDDADTTRATVSIWASRGEEHDQRALQRIAASFNDAHAKENIRAEITFFPQGQYPEKVAVAAASGALPDLVQVPGPLIASWAGQSILQPIGDLVTEEVRQDFLPSVIEQGTVKSDLYALAPYDTTVVVFYNREILEKAGIQPPEALAAAWGWQQFTDALEKVRAHTTVPLVLHLDSASDQWLTRAFAPLIWSNGGELIDAQKNKAVGILDSDQNIETLKNWEALFRKRQAQVAPSVAEAFAEGQAAFDWNVSSMLSFYQEKKIKVGVMPLPRMGDKPFTASESWAWGMVRSAKNRDAAWKALEWFVSKESGIRPMVAKGRGIIPGRKSALALLGNTERMPERLLREQLLEAARPVPPTPAHQALAAEFALALHEVSRGADARESLTRAAKAVQIALDSLQPVPAPLTGEEGE